MNLPFRIGGIWLAGVFILSLVGTLWRGAPSFVVWVVANRAFLTGVGVGIMASGFIRNIYVVLAFVAVAYIVLKVAGI